MGFKFVLTNEIRKASLIIGLKKHLKQNFKLTNLAKQKNIPIYSIAIGHVFFFFFLLDLLVRLRMSSSSRLRPAPSAHRRMISRRALLRQRPPLFSCVGGRHAGVVVGQAHHMPRACWRNVRAGPPASYRGL